ncbi:MAG: RNA-binding S4 domain-containing protein [Sphingomonadales bacterium]|nr:RNA-binding S4 domain-containing protein [Sphingomonadales bacterium]MDE2568314.1 RNA-binding S4 domain-containing protein [Sphingomonadales bacterium]
MRIDKLLFFLRLARTRGLARQWAEAGHIRVNGRRVERASAPVAPGDVLTLPLGDHVAVLRLLALPARRGPAAEARSCYERLDEMLDAPAASPLAANDSTKT